MNYLSVCSGIEAATVAWHHMGWKPIGFSEIEKFPSQVLQHHYPNVTNYGDMTKYKEWKLNDTIGLLVGGTPCQSFSVAGLRKGLEDPRGNLMLTYLGIANHFKPKWILWENVPGVLSSNGGKDFACFLQGLAELRYGFAYRVLDAQHFGVPQRRRRVFVVGCLGDWQSAAKVLFESESLCRDITPSREKRKEITGFVESSFGQYREDIIAGTTKASGGVLGGGSETFITAYNITFCDANGTRKDRPNGGLYVNETDVSNTLTNAGVGTNVMQSIAVNGTIQGDVTATMTAARNSSTHSSSKVMVKNSKPFKETADCLTAAYGTKWNGNASATNGSLFAHYNMAVRRLTPIECERLQGFPDNYTNIKQDCPDGHRYKALGNSMAVPVMKWIGERINVSQ
jgi:DNA (cytosine-5)-methyltransferase 1